MTIGIAGFGPHAGRAVVRALASVEAVGRGAIGGFVSLVVLNEQGEVNRASVQRGGTLALFGPKLKDIPPVIADSRMAVLMSSGPDRPEPLSQFTPAASGVGLVTGHRMPNTVGINGLELNGEVLKLMCAGALPQVAVRQVVDANPDIDAGIIALDVDGNIFASNTRHVALRGDAGRAQLGSRELGATVAVLHNAIYPHQPLASLAAHVAMDTMHPNDKPDASIDFTAGIPLVHGPTNAVEVNDEGTVTRIHVENPKFLIGTWSIGIGYRTAAIRRSNPYAVMLYEPYMVVSKGRLQSADGQQSLSVPVRKI